MKKLLMMLIFGLMFGNVSNLKTIRINDYALVNSILGIG